ncbi:MAG: glycosyltransferase family 87 protein [Fibrobacterota bacterium]
MNPLSRKSLIVLFTAFPVGAFLAWAVWRADLGLVSSTYGRTFELYELFGFCISLALISVAAIEVRLKRKAGWKALSAPGLFILVSFTLLAWRTEYPGPSMDYQCFERSAVKHLQGQNPYPGTKYEYPPLMVQATAFSFKVLKAGAAVIHLKITGPGIWRMLYFLYSALHFAAILAAFLLLYRLALRIGYTDPWASLVCAGLFLFNTPLLQAIQFNQTNIFILDVLLAVLLLPKKFDWLSGLLVAVGTAFKLYPVLILLPWAVLRRTRALAFAALGGVAILAVQTHGFTDWTLYGQFFSFFLHDYPQYTHYRNNCFYSLAANTFTMIRYHVVGMDGQTWRIFSGTFSSAAVLLCIAWFAWRGLRRRLSFLSALHYGQDRATANEEHERRWLLDMLPLMLLVSPTVWPHHFVLVMPFALQALYDAKQKSPMLIGLFVGLVFLLPVFDFYPFSYHRLAGLIGLCLVAPMTLSFLKASLASVPRA